MSREVVSPSHTALYKRKNLIPWKENFRKRCVERLKNNRERLVNNLRAIPKDIAVQNDDLNGSVVMEVMAEEWESMWDHPMFKHSDMMSVDDEWEDERILLLQEIQQELMMEEQLIIQEHQINIEIEEDYIMRAISDEVICPICQKLPLEEIYHVIKCPCGFKLETKQDNMRLQDFRQKLFEGLHFHSSSCQGKPCFSTTNLGGITNLLISCALCDFMHIVL